MPMRYPHDHENDVIYFGKVNFRNQMQTFGIKTDDRRRHVYVVGKTGMGKTTLLENMVLSDIYAGHGCAYIDPHGDTAEKLLDYIPSWRINDVVYFNPYDLDHPIGFNILEAVDEKMKHLVAAGMMSVFKKIWEGVWSARMEYILNNTILALMDTPNTTLLGINRMLSDDVYRKEVISNVKDPIVKQFWVMEFESYQSKFASEAVAPIQNKVGQFLSASIIRNIVAQAQSSMNIREIMDNQKIFIVNLSKGRIGEDASRLLGGLLITKIQMSAMERVDMPEEDRQDFYMYVDEFQNFAVESFANILSEARKYRLNLIMAHQYIAQLTEEVRDAVFGNVGTIISFRVGGPDAAFMEEEFQPRFLPNDMINLPKFHIYLKLMIDGVTSQPFSALTLAPIATNTGSRDKVIEQSRERYAGSREKIEEKVAEWSGFGKDVDLEKKYDTAKKVKKDAKKARFSHDYTCTRCKKVFPLPVELDRSRPIYCEDCHPIIMEERKKGKKRGDFKKNEREKNKKVVTRVPKISDGEVVVKDTGKSVGLSALSSDKIVEKKTRQHDKKISITERKPLSNDKKSTPSDRKVTPAVSAREMLSAKKIKTENVNNLTDVKVGQKDDREHRIKKTDNSTLDKKRNRKRRKRSKGNSFDKRSQPSNSHVSSQSSEKVVDTKKSQGNKADVAPVKVRSDINKLKNSQPQAVLPGERVKFDE